MSDIKLSREQFDFHFKKAPDLSVLPDGFDPVNDLYEFNASAGNIAYKKNETGYDQPVQDDNGNGPQFQYYQAVADAQGGFTTRSNLCLGAFTHTSYRVGRFGEIFEAKWVMQREWDGSVKSCLKDYEADQDDDNNRLSIAPEDLGRVFKGEEFTEAMATFHKDYLLCLQELSSALKDPLDLKELTPQILGYLSAAVHDNDLAGVFGLLYKPEFIEHHLDLINKTIKLYLYLEAGLALSKNNSAYQINAPHKIKKDLRTTYRFFGGITKRSGEKQASQVQDRLTDTSVLNTLVMRLLGNPEFYEVLTQTPGVSESIVDTPASDSETSLATPSSDNTDDVDGPSDLSLEVRAALEASSGAPVGRHDDVDGLRESRSGDALASPINSPDPVLTTAPASDPSSTTDFPPPVTATAACQIQNNRIIPSAKSNINFESGKDTLTDASKTALRELAQFLKDHPDLQNIHINGHTDNVGSDENNMDLSHRRAVAVLRFFVNEGVDPNRLTATGYGEAMPSDTNRTSSGRTNNRRVEFVIVESQPDGAPTPAAPAPSTTTFSATTTASGNAISFTSTKSSFKITETAPEFAFTGDASEITSVTNGFNKKPLSFTTEGGKLVVTGLQGYSKAVIKHFKNQDALLDDAGAKDKARMSYPIVVTLTDGSVVKLIAKGE